MSMCRRRNQSYQVW